MLYRLNPEQSANLKQNQLKRFICQRRVVKLADYQNNGVGQHLLPLSIPFSRLLKSLKQLKAIRFQHSNAEFHACRLIWPIKVVGIMFSRSLLKRLLKPLSTLLIRLSHRQFQDCVKQFDYQDYAVARVGSIIQLIGLFAGVAQDYRLCWLQNMTGAIHQHRLFWRLHSL